MLLRCLQEFVRRARTQHTLNPEPETLGLTLTLNPKTTLNPESCVCVRARTCLHVRALVRVRAQVALSHTHRSEVSVYD